MRTGIKRVVMWLFMRDYISADVTTKLFRIFKLAGA